MSQISFTYEETSQISEQQLSACFPQLEEYTMHLKTVIAEKNYQYDESSLNLISDHASIQTIGSLAQTFQNPQLRYVVVIGIGGSNLGTMAVYNALRRSLDQLKTTGNPKLLFAETVSASYFKDLLDILKDVTNENEFVINIISKSGGTTETISIFETLFAAMKETFPHIKDRIVVTTDDGSKLFHAATELQIPTLLIPEKVGGRFSVFSSVGLFPLMLANIDVDALVEGAVSMRTRCLESDDNIALISAALILAHKERGIVMNNNFYFNVELEYLGRWYRQLMGESVGKEHDSEGNVVHQGITPIVSIGSTDLHSMAQLYIGGPNDKFTQFVYHHETDEQIHVPHTMLFPNLVQSIEDKNFGNIMDAIIDGVKISYRKRQIPYCEVDFDTVDAFTIGNYLQFKMIEMMYLGKMMGVNTFNQPNVEDYKRETRALLANA